VYKALIKQLACYELISQGTQTSDVQRGWNRQLARWESVEKYRFNREDILWDRTEIPVAAIRSGFVDIGLKSATFSAVDVVYGCIVLKSGKSVAYGVVHPSAVLQSLLIEYIKVGD
jgi:hypothetical protein